MGDNQQNNQISGAITFPSGSQENVQPVPDQPRQPRNLQGLLRFAMEATKQEDAPSGSHFSPMDAERRIFLEDALQTLTIDMTQIIRDSLDTLTNEEQMKRIQLGDSLPSEVQQAFDNLLELVDNIDIANDFFRMGGYTIFPICLNSENERVRALACTILGETCQNNPFCQSRALEAGLLPVLMTLVQSERGEPLAKAIYALSCLCREYTPACSELTSRGGCELLALHLGAEHPAARTKAAFLIRHLCYHYPDAKEKFIDQNLVKTVALQIKNGRDATTEHLFSILLALLENRDLTVIQQCTDPELGLLDILETHLEHPELQDDTYSEEKEYCLALVHFISSCPQVESVREEGDR